LLPLGAPTMSTVFIASMGILVPFSVFSLLIFLYLHSLWMGNADDSPAPEAQVEAPVPRSRSARPSDESRILPDSRYDLVSTRRSSYVPRASRSAFQATLSLRADPVERENV
jgi:hypothetical protein